MHFIGYSIAIYRPYIYVVHVKIIMYIIHVASPKIKPLLVRDPYNNVKVAQNDQLIIIIVL